jgi:hypothetical protein
MSLQQAFAIKDTFASNDPTSWQALLTTLAHLDYLPVPHCRLFPHSNPTIQAVGNPVPCNCPSAWHQAAAEFSDLSHCEDSTIVMNWMALQFKATCRQVSLLEEQKRDELASRSWMYARLQPRGNVPSRIRLALQNLGLRACEHAGIRQHRLRSCAVFPVGTRVPFPSDGDVLLYTTLSDSGMTICVLREGARWRKHSNPAALAGLSVQFHLFSCITGAHDSHWAIRNPSQFDEYDPTWGISRN